MKDSVQTQLKLPRRIEREHLVELDLTEGKLYNFFKSQASRVVTGRLTHGSMVSQAHPGGILPLINLLRYICNHREALLPSSAAELWKNRTVSSFSSRTEAEISEPTTLESQCPQNSEFHYNPSTKVKALITNLGNEQGTNSRESGELPIKR